jgi:iron complex outermembrane receptor protein
LGGPPVPIGDPSRTEREQNIVDTSNPALQPEDSTSFTAGIVWTPKFIPGLTLTVDLWDTEQTGQVILDNIPAILRREEQGALLPGEVVQRDAQGFIQRIFVPFINSGSTTASGVDVGLQYVYQSNFGTFTWLTQVSYLDSFEFQGTPDARTAQPTSRRSSRGS